MATGTAFSPSDFHPHRLGYCGWKSEGKPAPPVTIYM